MPREARRSEAKTDADKTGTERRRRRGAPEGANAGLAGDIAMVEAVGRVAGNQATGHLIQTKLTVGPAGDKYEREADAIADRVARSLDVPVQRQPEDEELLQGKRVQRQEDEEELMMSRVQRQPEDQELLQGKRVQRQEDEEELMMSRVQRQPEEVEELLQGKRIRRHDMDAVGPYGGDLDAGTEGAIRSAGSGGRPLDADIRAKMEGVFGADFGEVRVHRDQAAADVSEKISAEAFTHGSDIFFGGGAPEVSTIGGQQLLAHELVHTLQQGAVRRYAAGRIRRRFLQPDDDPRNWKEQSTKRGVLGLFKKKRSKTLKAIDDAVEKWRVAERSGDRDTKRQAIERLLMAISQWRASKKEEGTSSRRSAEIDELQAEAAAIWLGLDEAEADVAQYEQAAPAMAAATQVPPAVMEPAAPAKPKAKRAPPAVPTSKPPPSSSWKEKKPAAAAKPKAKQAPPAVKQLVAAAKPKAKQVAPAVPTSKPPPSSSWKEKEPAAAAKPKAKQAPPAVKELAAAAKPKAKKVPPAVPTSKPPPSSSWKKKPPEAEATVETTATTSEGQVEPESEAKDWGDPFLNHLYTRIREGANLREIGWKMAWRVEIEGRSYDNSKAEDMFFDVLGEDDYEDGFEAEAEMKEAVVDLHGGGIRGHSDEYVEGVAELVWLGYSVFDAEEIHGFHELDARAIVSHGLDKEGEKERKKEPAVGIGDYSKAMAMLRHPLLRRIGKRPTEMVSYYPAFKELRKELDKDDAVVVVAELIKAGLPGRRLAATTQVFKYMTEVFAASAVDAARWIATLANAGITPDTYLSAVAHGNPKNVDRVERALGHARATRPTQQPEGEKTAFDPAQDLTDESVEYELGATVGGQMNKLDLLEYGFGLEQGETGFQKVAGGRFAGYFKEDVPVDTSYGHHRGTPSGIPEQDPGFGRRSLALFELDKWFGAGLIPPTFKARHAGKTGTVMQEVMGASKKGSSEALLQDPRVRRGLSNLYLLDYIAGQNDRHSQNVVITKDGSVYGIDNDLAFGADYQHFRGERFSAGGAAGVLVGELSEIDYEFARDIIAKAKDISAQATIRQALTGLISRSEVDAMIKRLLRLAEALEELESNSKALQELTIFENTFDGNPADAKFIEKWE